MTTDTPIKKEAKATFYHQICNRPANKRKNAIAERLKNTSASLVLMAPINAKRILD